MKPIRLITIPMSHYCEKARWALERQSIPYHEERHLQGFHYLRTYWVGGGLSVPVLVDGKKTLTNSTDILHHLDQYASPENRLYPEEIELRTEVERLEVLFNEQLGVESRRWIYFHNLNQPDKALAIASQGVPTVERILGPLCFPLMKSHINKLLQISEETVQAGLDQCHEIFNHTESLLADGRKYLVGDHFTAADLTFACMVAPFVLPRQYGIKLPTVEEMPPSTQNTIKAIQKSKSGQFALHLFATERS